MSRKILGVWLAWLVFILLPGPASATFHLVKVVEVFAGITAEPTAQYVMLQMYSPGQTSVTGHSLTVFDANGAMVGTFTFSHNLSNGSNLATMLIATPEAATLFGITADLSMTPVIPLGGGAVCWDVVDCEAWGTFSAPSLLPKLPGTPFNAPMGLLLDMAIHRDVSRGGAVTDFAFAPPAPKNNAGQSGTLSATPTMPPMMTPTPTPQSTCPGDCNGDGQVIVNELIQMVTIALGDADVSTCPAADANGDGMIEVNDIIAGVNNALNGCVAN